MQTNTPRVQKVIAMKPLADHLRREQKNVDETLHEI